jgi:hypothetical protein
VLQGVDRATGAVTAVRGAIAGLVSQSNIASRQSGNLGAVMQQSMFRAGLAVEAVKQGVGALINTVQGMTGAFAEATNIQSRTLAAANTLKALAGISLVQGEQSIDRLNQRLAVSAAVLPGATQDYKNLALGITDNLVPAFKLAGGGFDTKGFEDATAKLAESYTSIALTAGSNTQEANLFLTKFLNNASEAQLSILSFNQNQPAILGQLKAELDRVAQAGGNPADLKTRIAILQKVGEKFLDKEFKERASTTVDSLVQSFKTNLFDPDTGLFGLMRKVQLSDGRVQSAFQNFNEALNALIGNNGLFNTIGIMLQNLGIQGADPMKILAEGFATLTRFIQGVNRLFSGVKTFDNLQTTIQQLLGIASTKAEQLVVFLATLTRQGLETLGAILRSINWTEVANGLYGFYSRLLQSASQSLSGFDASGFLSSVLGSLSQAASAFASAIAPLINQALTLIMNFLNTVDWSALGIAFGDLVARVLGGIVNILAGLDYGAILISIGRLTIGVVSFVVTALASFGVQLIAQVGQALGTLVINVLKGVTDIFIGLGTLIMDLIKSIPGRVKDAASNAFNSVWNPMAGNTVSSPQQQAAIAPMNSVIPTQGKLAIAPMNSVIPTQGKLAIAPVAAATVPQLGSPQTSQTAQSNSTPAWLKSSFVSSHFMGQVPNAANGLMSAAVAEERSMPTNAEIVVANDQEFILKPTGKQVSSGNQMFNFYITGSDPQAIADAVIMEINRRFRQQMEVQLT